MIRAALAEVRSVGGTTQDRFISPKGLYSKPKGENALLLQLSKGNHQNVVLAVQKDITLDDGDVYVTDDRNYIHFKYSGGVIHIKGDTIFADNVKIEKDLHVQGAITCDTTIEATQSIKAGTDVEAVGNAISAACLSGTYSGTGGGAMTCEVEIKTTKTIEASDVKAGSVSLKSHIHPIIGGSSAGNTGAAQ